MGPRSPACLGISVNYPGHSLLSRLHCHSDLTLVAIPHRECVLSQVGLGLRGRGSGLNLRAPQSTREKGEELHWVS